MAAPSLSRPSSPPSAALRDGIRAHRVGARPGFLRAAACAAAVCLASLALGTAACSASSLPRSRWRRAGARCPSLAIERVQATRIKLAPGQATGLHRHPCDVVGYIAAETIAFAPEGEEPRTLRAGDTFHEPAGARIAHFDNASDTETVTFIAFYLLPPGEDELIEPLV